MSKILIIDSHSLIHRAYHALPKEIMSKGKHTNAVYGFTRMILKLITTEKPDYLFVAHDAPGPTFRTDMADTYKATRKPTHDDLIEQFDYMEDVLSGMNVAQVKISGYEADDLIATITKRVKEPTDEVYIVSGDTDLMQLVGKGTFMLMPVKGIANLSRIDVQGVLSKFGLPPERISQYKALRGDPTDNIFGVPGIGEKTAVELLTTYKDFDDIYEHINDLKPVLKQKLLDGQASGRISLELGALHSNAPLNIRRDEGKFSFEPEKYLKVFEKYGFNSLVKQYSLPTMIKDDSQMSML